MLFTCTPNSLDHVSYDSTGVELKQQASYVTQSSSRTLGDWCQAPSSWAFGLPNIVVFMGFVCIIAIISTIVAIILTNRDQKAGQLPREEKVSTPTVEEPVPGTADRILTDKEGNKWLVEEGAGHSFLVYQTGKTFTASHDGSWREIKVRSEGGYYVYTDNLGKGSFLCTQAGAPFGNLLKMQMAVPAGGR